MLGNYHLKLLLANLISDSNCKDLHICLVQFPGNRNWARILRQIWPIPISMGQENVDDCFYLIEWDPVISAIFSTADRYIDGQLKGTLSVRKKYYKN